MTQWRLPPTTAVSGKYTLLFFSLFQFKCPEFHFTHLFGRRPFLASLFNLGFPVIDYEELLYFIACMQVREGDSVGPVTLTTLLWFLAT